MLNFEMVQIETTGMQGIMYVRCFIVIPYSTRTQPT